MAVLSAPTPTPTSAGVRPVRLVRPRRDRLRRDRLRRDRLRWLAIALTASGAGLIPWLVVLATCLPATTRAWNWSAAWAGLDGLEALGLLGTGLLLIRRDARYHLTAAATAAFLLVDAWFDVTTSAPGADRMMAIAMAAGLELPAVVACAVLAARGYRTYGHVREPDHGNGPTVTGHRLAIDRAWCCHWCQCDWRDEKPARDADPVVVTITGLEGALRDEDAPAGPGIAR